MENTIKRLIALMMIFIMSFSVITCASSNDFTVSAASSKTISIKTKPTLKASKVKATTVKLSWSETKGATSYRVYKSTDKKKWTLVTKTKKTSYTVKELNGNKKYYFRVRAYKTTNGKTTKSPYSKTITIKTKKNETVYAKKNVNIRTKSNTKSKVITVLKKGKSIKRIGYAKNGWSKVLLDGETAYIVSSYLTTKKPVEETTKKKVTTTKKKETTTKKKKPTTEKETEWTTRIYIDEEGNKISVDPNGFKSYITDGGGDYDGSYCRKCGSKDCKPSTKSYTCIVCKKKIAASECHDADHFRASH